MGAESGRAKCPEAKGEATQEVGVETHVQAERAGSAEGRIDLMPSAHWLLLFLMPVFVDRHLSQFDFCPIRASHRKKKKSKYTKNGETRRFYFNVRFSCYESFAS